MHSLRSAFGEGEGPSSETRPASPRRLHPRHAVGLDVTVSSARRFYTGYVENLSPGGMFIATHRRKNVGERIGLALWLPSSPQPIRAVGEVRWLRECSEEQGIEPGMGVQFTEVAPGGLEQVEAFLGVTPLPRFYDDE